ncbi:MAG: hypothetical protein RBT60_06840 [Candidatus Krumholzibacteria bacterium]|nr:hypothetical protein [Candidatus Krumholzibacteria bacterium]
MQRAVTALFLAWLLLAATRAQAAGEPARVITVTPARTGTLVVAHLTTVGLPGEKLVQSMRSGLTSAVQLDLALLDEKQQELGGNSLSLQLGFDLWDEVFSVHTADCERRFRSLAELQEYLTNLAAVPVITTDRLSPRARYRLRVGLQAHAIAPAQQERVEDVIAGNPRSRREGHDRQEASVSLGRLIRLFYKSGERSEGTQETLSDWFGLEELRDETH